MNLIQLATVLIAAVAAAILVVLSHYEAVVVTVVVAEFIVIQWDNTTARATIALAGLALLATGVFSVYQLVTLGWSWWTFAVAVFGTLVGGAWICYAVALNLRKPSAESVANEAPSRAAQQADEPG